MDGQIAEEYSVQMEVDTEPEWKYPWGDWSESLKVEFIKWFAETYGTETIHRHLEEFRAVKDVQASVEPKTNPYTDHLAHAMMHTKQVMAANLMKKMWGEDDGNDTKGLWSKDANDK